MLKKMLRMTAVTGMLIGAACFPAFAAGWEQVDGDGDWVWRDKDGSVVYDTWKKGADGTWYYLGSDGIMVKDSLIEVDADRYYVDGEGRMIKEQWKRIYADDGEEYWYYFRDSGKAYKGNGSKASLKTIGDKRYIFDAEGRMQYGWVAEDGCMVDEDDSEGWKDAVYYCGTEDEGWVTVGWAQIEVDHEDERKDRRFYFGNNGKKTVDKDLKVKDANGKEYQYGFDEYGVVLTQKLISTTTVNADGTTTTMSRYYDNKGTLNRAQWIERVPSASQDADDHANDVKRKFYSLKNGDLVKDAIKRIDGKYYCFDAVGIMRVGLVAIKDGRYAYTLQNTNEDDDIWADVSDLVNAKENGCSIMYFDEKTGARKTGRINIDLGDRYTMRFLENGEAADGEYQGHLYEAGILLKAGQDNEETYQEFTVNGIVYSVDRSGKIQR